MRCLTGSALRPVTCGETDEDRDAAFRHEEALAIIAPSYIAIRRERDEGREGSRG